MIASALSVTALLALADLQHLNVRAYLAIFFLQLILYAFAGWRLLAGKLHQPHRERRALIAVLAIALLLRGIALLAPSTLSTDAYRYVWDGRVQAAGINPYRYVPADPALAGLRDTAIYPNINRADYAHTIYPPAAQLIFLAAERVHDSFTTMKLTMLGFDALTIAGLIALLRRRKLPATRVLLYAWHPLPIWEFAGAGHVDAAAIALLILAFVLAERRAPAFAGVALAAATLVKYYPVALTPALYRRRDWRLPAAFAATAAALYLPYLSVGPAVLGFLPGYAQEEHLSGGSGFFLWALLERVTPLPDHGLAWYLPFAAAAMLALSLWLAPRARRWTLNGGFILASAFTVLASPHQPWYFAWLVPFLCFRFSLAHLWLTGVCVVSYVLPGQVALPTECLFFLPFFVLLLIHHLMRRPRSGVATDSEIADASCAQNPSAV